MPNNSRMQYFSKHLNINTCERYPRLRHTEFYRTPEPRPSVQSQKAEHAKDRLNRLPSAEAPTQSPRIQPPRNSVERVLRDSYFS
ncbi:uncharacterized protein DMAD_08348 [Drosophila madeirensis]|uniref:Uncharacterized protein n=1 Tax=Drosophila madeirensis TaxID=30013 RepID=A0AAU9EV81_DROMD